MIRAYSRIVTLALLLAAAAPLRAFAGDEAQPPPADPNLPPVTEEKSAETPPAPPAKAEAPGAASPEPGQAIDEDPGDAEHEAWVESIWASP